MSVGSSLDRDLGLRVLHSLQRCRTAMLTGMQRCVDPYTMLLSSLVAWQGILFHRLEDVPGMIAAIESLQKNRVQIAGDAHR